MEAPLKAAIAWALVLASVAMSACSSQQAYNTAQAWQQNQCNRQVDNSDRERCINKAATPYEVYQQQAAEQKRP